MADLAKRARTTGKTQTSPTKRKPRTKKGNDILKHQKQSGFLQPYKQDRPSLWGPGVPGHRSDLVNAFFFFLVIFQVDFGGALVLRFKK